MPPEIWNRLETKILPKLRSGSGLKIEINFTIIVEGWDVANFRNEIKQILDDLGLSESVKIE